MALIESILKPLTHSQLRVNLIRWMGCAWIYQVCSIKLLGCLALVKTCFWMVWILCIVLLSNPKFFVCKCNKYSLGWWLLFIRLWCSMFYLISSNVLYNLCSGKESFWGTTTGHCSSMWNWRSTDVEIILTQIKTLTYKLSQSSYFQRQDVAP